MVWIARKTYAMTGGRVIIFKTFEPYYVGNPAPPGYPIEFYCCLQGQVIITCGFDCVEIESGFAESLANHMMNNDVMSFSQT